MEIQKQKLVHTELSKSRPFSIVEVTKWTNEEGYAINISSGYDNKMINVTHGEFDAIKKCIKYLNKYE